MKAILDKCGPVFKSQSKHCDYATVAEAALQQCVHNWTAAARNKFNISGTIELLWQTLYTLFGYHGSVKSIKWTSTTF